MSVIQDSYIGFAEESTYGTAVLPTRFIEMPSENIVGKYERINSEGFRAGQKVLRKDRFEVNPKGAEGDVTFEVTDQGVGFLFKHMLGAVSSGAAVGGFTPHTFTLGDLKGKALTTQVGRVDASGVSQTFTYEGGKVTSWNLTNQVDGVLQLKLDMDYEKETIGSGAGAYAAATPTYVAGSTLFVFTSAVVTIGGTAFGVSDISLSGDNKLKTDRYYSSNSGMKKEPLVEGLRELSWELTGEFDGLTHANRVAAALATGALAQIICTWTSAAGGSLTVTIPNARFDEGPVNFDGAQLIEHKLSGVGLEDGSVSPITVLYSSKDATP